MVQEQKFETPQSSPGRVSGQIFAARRSWTAPGGTALI